MFAGPVDNDWHRPTGDLKCAACGKVTRHALPLDNDVRDFAERWQRITLGDTPPEWWTQQQIAQMRRNYRRGLPRNPYLKHWYPRARRIRAKIIQSPHP